MVTTVLSTVLLGCDHPLDTNREVEPSTSFGGIVYREGCQRVAYTGQLAQKAAGERDTVDVAGGLGRSVCIAGMAPPADAPPKLAAIQNHKGSLIATVDAILPKKILQDMQDFMVALLPLSDDGTFEKAITSLGELLGIMRDDPDFAPALARLQWRTGYRPTQIAAGLMHTILEYPGIDDFLGKVLGLIGPGGSAEAEWKQVLKALGTELSTAQPVANPGDPERTLRLALNLVLSRHADLVTGSPRPLVARDYRGMAAATTIAGKVQPPFADGNNDGLADVDVQGRYVDAAGQPLNVPSPFPETMAGDGAPRDAQGRALASAQSPSTIYKYLDLDGTMIAGLTREAIALMDPKKDITLGMIHGASALLGPRLTQTKMYMDPAGGMVGTLTYNGYDVTQSALLDLIHSFVQILGDPNADQTLRLTSTLLSKYESQATRVVGAMLDAKERGKAHPEAQVPASSTVYDDLMPLVQRILRVPGLAEDLLIALEDPHAKGFAPMIGRLMSTKNAIDFNHTGGPDFNLTSSLDGELPVDRTMPDVDYNRSLMQRIAHLIHDANGVQFCNKQDARFSIVVNFGPYDKCKLFQVDDLALLYVLSMATPSLVEATKSTRYDTTYSKASFREQITADTVRNLIFENGVGDTLLQDQTGIAGFTRFPNPKALNRALFLRTADKTDFMKGTTEDITCRDGDKFIDVHDKSLFAWETRMVGNPAGFPNDSFYDAVRPLVDAFVKHDECIQYNAQGACTKLQNAGKIFVDVLAMLHTHWGSPKSSYSGKSYQATNTAAPRFAFPDNIVSYEPLLADVLRNSDLVPAIIGLAPVLNTMTVDGTVAGQPARPVLIGTAKYLFEPAAAKSAGIVYRNGAISTVYSDGKTPVPQATPYYLMADAFAHRRTVLDQVGGAQAQAWRASTSALVDQMLSVEKVGTAYRFKNRRVHAVTLLLVDFVRGRLSAHARAGNLADWVHKDLTRDLTDVLGGPTFAALGDFVAKVEGDPEARDQLYKLISYLVDETNNDPVFATALTTLTDQVQTFLDDPNLVPVARVLGRAMDPATGPIDPQLTLVKKARDLDAKKMLLEVLRNLYRQNAAGAYPASDLSDILSELNRARPGQGGALDAADYRALLGEISTFLLDEQRGYPRFLNIVKTRGPH